MKRIQALCCIAVVTISTIYAHQEATLYTSVTSIASRYKRPFTILDFGAGDGTCSLALAKDFPGATCVMIDEEPDLLAQCHKKQLTNLIYLHKKLSCQELSLLSECEHFDIIILGKVLDTFGQKWTDAFRFFRKMGDHLIIENPPRQLNTPASVNRTRRTISRFLETHATPILNTINHKNTVEKTKIYHVDTGKFHTIERKVYPWQEKLPRGSHTIESDYNHKKLIKSMHNTITSRSWIAGINFFTFKMLNGQFPTKETLKESLIGSTQKHPKVITANNIIMQGSTMKIVNRSPQEETLERPGEHAFYFNKHISEVLSMIDSDSPQSIAQLCLFR